MVQSRIKTVEKMDVEAPEPVVVDPVWRFSIPASEPLGRPIISVDDVSFDYNTVKEDGTKKKESEFLLQKVNFGIDVSEGSLCANHLPVKMQLTLSFEIAALVQNCYPRCQWPR
jgi:ATPase subunit of ABC transporter with duplicated ATPase domains